MISSTSWLSNSQRTRLPLPCTCSSLAGLAFSSLMAAATSPEKTVVSAHCGSLSVVDATYLGFVFNAVQMGLSPGSAHVPHEPADLRDLRRLMGNVGRTGRRRRAGRPR